ncbi:hypothetical protein C5167_046533 [Papaver somniferum]|uniref:Major facilitator superfamily (MFS) profile domain-containing protein n=1 Tax=Papaver somniferum TaxID=3469 RepID=A0A4Y7LET4_PAPSO|nr:hypothetical protein C5167_046533 [Papaver somniferum]
MVGGAFDSSVGGAKGKKEYPGELTGFLLFTCLIAACGGLIFGYDIGISGGVTAMTPFLQKFFPKVYRQEIGVDSANQYCKFNSIPLTFFTSSLYLAALLASLGASWATKKFGRKIVMFTGDILLYTNGRNISGVTAMTPFLQKFFPKVYRQEIGVDSANQYCKFNSIPLTFFTSSLYLAALLASLGASWATKKFGRKIVMFTGGSVFLLGAVLNGFAQDLAMLIIGRILLGIGVGCATQSVPLYLSEMAPYKYRGALNSCFQLMITVGIFLANLVNFFTNKMTDGPVQGWRVSLGLAVVPALIMTVGGFFLPDTPNSFISRNQPEEAKKQLQRIRGSVNIDEEFNDLVAGSRISERRYRPHLCLAILIPFFQQFTGINVVMFYAPVLFTTLGFGSSASLLSAMITGGVNLFATFFAIYFVDKWGRRVLFLEGGCQMFIFQVLIGVLIWIKFGTTGIATISSGYGILVVLCICAFVAGFAWSWAPLAWLVPSEIFPLEIRSAAQSVVVMVNMFCTFLIAQIFLIMLCHMKFGLFFFFGGMVAIMTVFIYFFVPETKGIPIEEVSQSVPLYLSEMAPYKYRGALNSCFQLMITVGIFLANLVNFFTNKMTDGPVQGWRVSLGLAVVPALIMTVGGFFLPDTPNSFISRNQPEEAKKQLQRIRGSVNIDEEFNDLVAAGHESQKYEGQWNNLIQRRYRPHLCLAILIPFFQQFTGINVVMFYAPVLFTTLGFGSSASLLSAMITGGVNLFATFFAIYFVDKWGRRVLFLEGGCQMFIFQVLIGVLIWIKFGTTGIATISSGYGILVVLCICAFVAGFAWSWAPLAWLVPSEIFPLEIRSAAQSVVVMVNMFCTFLIAQIFLIMLCHMKFGLFFFFGGMVAIMTVFIYFFVPETKGIPIEEVSQVLKNHWYWGRFITQDIELENKRKTLNT